LKTTILNGSAAKLTVGIPEILASFSVQTELVNARLIELPLIAYYYSSIGHSSIFTH